MNLPITYEPRFLLNPDVIAETLWNELDWERRDSTPRFEYYSSMNGEPYTYGRGAGVRTYESKPWHPLVTNIKLYVESYAGAKMDVCFLNGYADGSDHLGWHSDNSPEMDDARPIAIVSLGADREIWFRDIARPDPTGFHSSAMTTDLAPTPPEIQRLRLGNGSLCLMHPGMQDTHQHRIPKAGNAACGRRISLTFRGFVA